MKHWPQPGAQMDPLALAVAASLASIRAKEAMAFADEQARVHGSERARSLDIDRILRDGLLFCVALSV